MDEIELRPKLRWFAEQMELRLRANDWKGGWHNERLGTLCAMLRIELSELARFLFPRRELELERITSEAADVANFVMMIADNARREASQAPAAALRAVRSSPPGLDRYPEIRKTYNSTQNEYTFSRPMGRRDLQACVAEMSKEGWRLHTYVPYNITEDFVIMERETSKAQE